MGLGLKTDLVHVPDGSVLVPGTSRDSLLFCCLLLQEIGPFKKGWEPREYAWTTAADVLFLDNPVGTGFSYVDDLSLLGA